MNWFVVDAAGEAFKRTRSCLLEPFDLKKWIKLAIIVALAGGGGSSGYNSSTPQTETGEFPQLPFFDPAKGNGFIDQITAIPDLPVLIAP